MECLFIGVKTLNCSLHQRCEGIYQVMKNLGASKRDANAFSKYVWRRYFYNKMKDIVLDSPSGLFGSTTKILGKLVLSISKPFIRDSYGIEHSISAIEEQIFQWETSSESIKPITYFRRSGEGYGVIFKTAALLNNSNSLFVRNMGLLGKKLGTLITMRDSIQDRKLDAKTGNFNPFVSWNNLDMIKYYQKYRLSLATEIEELVKSTRSIYAIPKKTATVFKGLSIYVHTTTNPYKRCTKQLQKNTSNYLQNNTRLTNYIVDPGQPQPDGKAEEDTCYVDCCSPTCSGCCHIPNNPCGACCDGCDCCVDCCSGCGGAASGCA